VTPLLRWRVDRAERVARSIAVPATIAFVLLTVAVFAGIRPLTRLALLGVAGFALASNVWIAARALRRGPSFAAGYVSHLGVAVFLIGVICLGQFGREIPVELPLGQPKSAFGFQFIYRGLEPRPDGRTRAVIAVQGEGRAFRALPPIYYSEFNRGMMREPHVERFWDRDLYISPVEVVSSDQQTPGLTLDEGQSGIVGNARVTFLRIGMQRTDTEVRATADVQVDREGKSEVVRPAVLVGAGGRTELAATLSDGGTVSLSEIQADRRRVTLAVRTADMPRVPEALAVHISTKPMINLVWIGVSITLLGSLLAIRRRSVRPVGDTAPAG
jgi:cytochrome c-type biogenesis protein CcmF